MGVHFDMYDTARILGVKPRDGQPKVCAEWIDDRSKFNRREGDGDVLVLTQTYYAQRDFAYCGRDDHIIVARE